MSVLCTNILEPDTQACLNTRVWACPGAHRSSWPHKATPCGLLALGGPRHGGPRLPEDGSARRTLLCRSGPSGPLSTRTPASVKLTDSACIVLHAFPRGLSSDGAQRSPSQPAHVQLGTRAEAQEKKHSTCHV